MWQPRISEFIRPWPDDSGRIVMIRGHWRALNSNIPRISISRSTGSRWYPCRPTADIPNTYQLWYQLWRRLSHFGGFDFRPKDIYNFGRWSRAKNPPLC